MYRYYTNKRSPVAFWMLDDTPDFQEYSGSGFAGVMSAGSPAKSVPLVAGAGYSSVFKKSAVGRFDCNLFKQGLESRSFVLEAWVLPIPCESHIYPGNLADNPSGEVANGWSPNSGAIHKATWDTTVAYHGSQSRLSSPVSTANNVLSMYNVGHGLSRPVVTEGKTYTFGLMLMTAQAGDRARVSITWVRADNTNITTTLPAFKNFTSTNNWELFSATAVAPAGAVKAHLNAEVGKASGTYDSTAKAWADAAVFVENPTPTEYFDGSTRGYEWTGAPNASPTRGLTNQGVQKILSHANVDDGLTITGKVIRFGTAYASTGTAYCDYDLGEYRLAHVVGIHTEGKNQLWVNGVEVASVDITDAQKADSYASTQSEYLFCGTTESAQELAVNGVAFYPTLSGDDIQRNYQAGIEFVGRDRVYPQYGGVSFDLDHDTGAVFLDNSWGNRADFETGYNRKVSYAEDQIEPTFLDGVSQQGSWTTAVPLDAMGDTSIYGVMVSWSGLGVTADVSFDGTTWASATSGRLVSIVPNAFDPTGKDLWVRVNFAGGSANDTSYLESLRVVGFRNNTVKNATSRAVTVTHPAVLREDYEPNLYRDDNGINLAGGTLTIGPDTTTDPDVARTLELWVKPLSGSPVISVAGTKYRNSAVDSTLPIGEWSLVHYVAASDITSNITVSGDIIVGQATLYPTALTPTQVSDVWKSYTGAQNLRFSETQAVRISESASPAYIYAHDWAIDSAG